MMRLILAVSLCRSRSLPNVFIQGLLSLSPWARSLSDSASETSARKGIPRSAATVLARRKMASGISKVVFMSHAPIFMGASQLAHASAASAQCQEPGKAAIAKNRNSFLFMLDKLAHRQRTTIKACAQADEKRKGPRV